MENKLSSFDNAYLGFVLKTRKKIFISKQLKQAQRSNVKLVLTLDPFTPLLLLEFSLKIQNIYPFINACHQI